MMCGSEGVCGCRERVRVCIASPPPLLRASVLSCFDRQLNVCLPLCACNEPAACLCMLQGGYLAVTDANAVLGRVLPQFFPAIFGEGEDQPLDVDGAR